MIKPWTTFKMKVQFSYINNDLVEIFVIICAGNYFLKNISFRILGRLLLTSITVRLICTATSNILETFIVRFCYTI